MPIKVYDVKPLAANRQEARIVRHIHARVPTGYVMVFILPLAGLNIQLQRNNGLNTGEGDADNARI